MYNVIEYNINININIIKYVLQHPKDLGYNQISS